MGYQEDPCIIELENQLGKLQEEFNTKYIEFIFYYI